MATPSHQRRDVVGSGMGLGVPVQVSSDDASTPTAPSEAFLSSHDTTPTLGYPVSSGLAADAHGPALALQHDGRHEGRPTVARIETESLNLPRYAAVSKNSLFFSDTHASSPIAANHSMNKSSSSQPFEVASTSLSTTSLDSLGAPSSGSADATHNGGNRWAGGFGSSLQTPIGDLSSASSVRSRRNWDEFEGKPVSPLPSPAIHSDKESSMFDVPLSANKESFPSDASRTTTSSSPTKSSLSVSASAASPTSVTLTEPAPETPSKTSAFFGASWSAFPRGPTTKSAKGHTRNASGSEISDGGHGGSWSSLSGSRAVSADIASKMRHPSRLPTLPAESGIIPGTSAANARTIPAPTGLSTESPFPGHARLSSTESSMSNERPLSPFYSLDPNSSSRVFGLGSSSQASLSAISDAPSASYDGLPPSSSAFASHTSPRSAWNKLSLRDDERSTHSSPVSVGPSRADQRLWQDLDDPADAAYRTYGNGGPSSSSAPSTGRNKASRHFHGPSESATGSSLAPVTTSRNSLNKAHQLVEEEEAEEEEVGDQVGPYRIERTLGVGAFSRVALARLVRAPRAEAKTDKRISSLADLRQRALSLTKSITASSPSSGEDLVALKMLDREPCNQNERMRVSWVREVEVLKHISHPNLVRFVTSFSTPLHHTLVLEQVPGGELFDLLANHQSKIAQREWFVRRIFSELANAIGWMHHVNLVHRDIKLENILMTTQLFADGGEDLRPSRLPSGPLVKLTDFGLSRFVDPSNPYLETRCGSEEYAAPELIIGKKYDGRKTDAWALGVVLYALITGSLPFLEDLGGSGVTAAREGHSDGRDAKQRKTHLLRIAKGDLRWPEKMNEASLDAPAAEVCPPDLRLVTPTAKRMVARLLRRDSTKRASAWETWDEAWLLCGSFGTDASGSPLEASAAGEPIALHPDPRSQAGQLWLDQHANVRTSEVSQLACDD